MQGKCLPQCYGSVHPHRDFHPEYHSPPCTPLPFALTSGFQEIHFSRHIRGAKPSSARSFSRPQGCGKCCCLHTPFSKVSKWGKFWGCGRLKRPDLCLIHSVLFRVIWPLNVATPWEKDSAINAAGDNDSWLVSHLFRRLCEC